MRANPEPGGMGWEWIDLWGHRGPLPGFVREALNSLGQPGEDEFALRVAFNNLAHGYAAVRSHETVFGKWGETASQLRELAAAGEALAAQLRDLNAGARTFLARRLEELQSANEDLGDLTGLFPELVRVPPGLGTPPDDVEPMTGAIVISIVLGEGAHRVRERGPQWPMRVKALADAALLAARAAESRAQRGGLRTVSADFFGSAKLQLLHDCAKELHRRGKPAASAYRLARAVHQVVTGEAPSTHWAGEAWRRFRPWWDQVEPWVGKEAEAPAEIQQLLRGGLQGVPKRPRKRPDP